MVAVNATIGHWKNSNERGENLKIFLKPRFTMTKQKSRKQYEKQQKTTIECIKNNDYKRIQCHCFKKLAWIIYYCWNHL